MVGLSRKIKICGITKEADALFAENAGADAIGFNFYKPSPRYISPLDCAAITEKLSPFTSLFGVFVNEDIAEVVKIVKMCGLSVIQLHGDEDASYIANLRANIKVKIVKVLRLQSEADINVLNDFDCDYFLIDSFCKEYGGSGKVIDYTLSEKALATGKKIILAGGLTPENVAEIIAKLDPYAVDTASGVESSPGIKDEVKVKKFIDAVKSA